MDLDSLSPVIRREKRRAGLKIYTQVTIDLAADDPNRKETIQEVMNLMRASTPKARLEVLKKRAEKYPEDKVVRGELQWIEGSIGMRNRGQAVSFALLALSRGLDLLDTGLYLNTVLRDQKRQEGTRKKRRQDINAWISGRLEKNSAAKSPELWREAPDWITDQIGERRFAIRVTECRKARK